MVAFQHREGSQGWFDNENHEGPTEGCCCFLTHAFAGEREGYTQDLSLGRTYAPGLEYCFESHLREELKQECITFLAKHGTAEEASPTEEVAPCGG